MIDENCRGFTKRKGTGRRYNRTRKRNHNLWMRKHKSSFLFSFPIISPSCLLFFLFENPLQFFLQFLPSHIFVSLFFQPFFLYSIPFSIFLLYSYVLSNQIFSNDFPISSYLCFLLFYLSFINFHFSRIQCCSMSIFFCLYSFKMISYIFFTFFFVKIYSFLFLS